MAQRDNLYRRSSGIYVLRITVPVHYRALIGQREIHASTRTTHLANARAIAARLLEKWYASLEEFKLVDKEKIRGNAPLLAGAGKISLALFCESFDVGLETVVPHLLADNIPLYAFVDSGSEAMVNGYMQIYMPLHALNGLKKGLSTEITAFRANNGNPLALWLLDLPGVKVDSSSLFINNVQAEKLRSMWDKAFAKSEPELPLVPAVVPPPPPPPLIISNPFCNPLHASKTVSEVLEEFIAYKNSGDLKLASEEKIRSRISHFIDVMGDLTLVELDRNVVKKYVSRMQRMPSNLYLMQRRYAAEDLDQLIEKALDAGESLMTKDAIGRHMASLGSMLKWACKENYLIANPVENVLAKRMIVISSKMRNWNSYSLHTGLKLARVCRTNSGAILTFDLIAIGYPY